jgi:hypothetical protein
MILEEGLVLAQFFEVERLNLATPVGTPHGERFAFGHDKRNGLYFQGQRFEDVDDGEVVASDTFIPEQ